MASSVIQQSNVNRLSGVDQPAVSKMPSDRCTCCPYGYHIDLDFLRFLDSLYSGESLRNIRRVRHHRVPQSQSSYDGFFSDDEVTRWRNYAGPSAHSPLSPESGGSVGHVTTDEILLEIDNSMSRTLNSIDEVDTRVVRKKKPPRPLPDKSRLVSSEPRLQQAVHETVTSQTTTVTSTEVTSQSSDLASCQQAAGDISPGALQAIRDQLVVSLQRMRQLEDQVRIIPTMEHEIDELRQENARLRQMMLKMKDSNDQLLVADESVKTFRGLSGSIMVELPVTVGSSNTSAKREVRSIGVGDNDVYGMSSKKSVFYESSNFSRETNTQVHKTNAEARREFLFGSGELDTSRSLSGWLGSRLPVKSVISTGTGDGNVLEYGQVSNVGTVVHKTDERQSLTRVNLRVTVSEERNLSERRWEVERFGRDVAVQCMIIGGVQSASWYRSSGTGVCKSPLCDSDSQDDSYVVEPAVAAVSVDRVAANVWDGKLAQLLEAEFSRLEEEVIKEDEAILVQTVPSQFDWNGALGKLDEKAIESSVNAMEETGKSVEGETLLGTVNTTTTDNRELDGVQPFPPYLSPIKASSVDDMDTSSTPIADVRLELRQEKLITKEFSSDLEQVCLSQDETQQLKLVDADSDSVLRLNETEATSNWSVTEADLESSTLVGCSSQSSVKSGTEHSETHIGTSADSAESLPVMESSATIDKTTESAAASSPETESLPVGDLVTESSAASDPIPESSFVDGAVEFSTSDKLTPESLTSSNPSIDLSTSNLVQQVSTSVLTEAVETVVGEVVESTQSSQQFIEHIAFPESPNVVLEAGSQNSQVSDISASSTLSESINTKSVEYIVFEGSSTKAVVSYTNISDESHDTDSSHVATVVAINNDSSCSAEHAVNCITTSVTEIECVNRTNGSEIECAETKNVAEIECSYSTKVDEIASDETSKVTAVDCVNSTIVTVIRSTETTDVTEAERVSSPNVASFENSQSTNTSEMDHVDTGNLAATGTVTKGCRIIITETRIDRQLIGSQDEQSQVICDTGANQSEQADLQECRTVSSEADVQETSIVSDQEDQRINSTTAPHSDNFFNQWPEISGDMLAACSVYAQWLVDSSKVTLEEKKNNVEIIQKNWFQTAGRKSSTLHEVRLYLAAFERIHLPLLFAVVNMADNDMNTVLHYAVSHGNIGIIEILLDTGVCDIRRQNRAGYTPVMLAALLLVDTHQHRDVIKRLFGIGDVNVQSSTSGQTALMLAASHGRLEMLDLLLECGADVNARDNDGSTALMCACEHGYMDIVQTLLIHPQCDSTLTDVDGSTALSIAMEEGYRDIGVLLYAHMNTGREASPLEGEPDEATE